MKKDMSRKGAVRRRDSHDQSAFGKVRETVTTGDETPADECRGLPFIGGRNPGNVISKADFVYASRQRRNKCYYISPSRYTRRWLID